MQGLGDICGIDKAAALARALFYSAGFFLSMAATISLYLAFSMAESGTQPAAGDMPGIFGKAMGKFFIYLWTTFLYILIIFGGCILLIVPGIIFELQYIFAPILSVLDDGRGGKYFEKSLAMTEGRKWSIFVCSIFAGLYTLPVYIALLFLSCLAFFILKLPIGHGVLDAAGAIYTPVIMPYSCGVLYMIYKKLKD